MQKFLVGGAVRDMLMGNTVKISKGDIILEKEESDGLLFVVTVLHDGWFESIANVGNNKVIHRKISFDGDFDVVGNVSPQNFYLYGS